MPNSREQLIYSSHRRKPVSSALNFLDSGLAVTPEGGNPGRNDDLSFNQRFPSYIGLEQAIPGITLCPVICRRLDDLLFALCAMLG